MIWPKTKLSSSSVSNFQFLDLRTFEQGSPVWGNLWVRFILLQGTTFGYRWNLPTAQSQASLFLGHHMFLNMFFMGFWPVSEAATRHPSTTSSILLPPEVAYFYDEVLKEDFFKSRLLVMLTYQIQLSILYMNYVAILDILIFLPCFSVWFVNICFKQSNFHPWKLTLEPQNWWLQIQPRT